MTTIHYLSIAITILAIVFFICWVREIYLHNKTEKELDRAKFTERWLKEKIQDQDKIHDRLLTKLRESGVKVEELGR